MMAHLLFFMIWAADYVLTFWGMIIMSSIMILISIYITGLDLSGFFMCSSYLFFVTVVTYYYHDTVGFFPFFYYFFFYLGYCVFLLLEMGGFMGYRSKRKLK